MTLLFAVRLTRVLIHVLAGIIQCALMFPWATRARRDRVIARWSAQLLGMCGVELLAQAGAPALTHAMIVANHVSWLDIFVINALQPCRFVAKSEIRQWPLLGWLVGQAGTVFIARGSRTALRTMLKSLVASLQTGERVAFFPEGTTALQGEMLAFHANLFEAAIDAEVPVQPVALRYLDADGLPHPAVEFIGDMSFAGSVLRVLSARAIRAELICEAPLDARGAHRRELASAAQRAVAAALRARLS